MSPIFDLGDILIIKESSQFQEYDESYVIEFPDSLKVRRVIETGDLERNRGVLTPANNEFKEAVVNISDLYIRGQVIASFNNSLEIDHLI